MKGKIIKGIAGFYYVHVAEEGIYECKAKGIFRKDNRKPLVGDDVLLDVIDQNAMIGNVCEILPRHSELIRPAVANVDQAVIIFSITQPQPNLNLLDRFLIMMQQQNLPCIICFNKLDIDEAQDAEKYKHIYENCGYQTLLASAVNKEGVEELKQSLLGKTSTVAGPSGVGKSSLINCLQSDVKMETGIISHKIQRGKHTTRHTELIAITEDAYILDTPGFSSLGIFDLEKEELSQFYPEFELFEVACKFGGCSHINEPVCGIKDALKEEKISPVRYANYVQLYNEIKDKKKY